ncbi:unnamed protein product [Symbiodinium natans]|uniref:Uncharacterized protein n=1 Tax=Symbiodinium natans TaxID=878477 RepID=A0A812I585_9DINO|nr:unnamed protein product [Symbiodinium natans]
MMPTFELSVAFVLVVCIFHGRTTWADAMALAAQWSHPRQMLSTSGASNNGALEKRVDAGMDRVREESYVMTARLAQHVNFVALVSMPFAYKGEGIKLAGMMLITIFLYLFHLLLAARRIRFSGQGLRHYFGFAYLILIGAPWLVPVNASQSAAHMKMMEASQFISIMVFLDSRVHIPGQVVVCLSEICRHVVHNGWDETSLPHTVCAQLVFSGLLITASISAESQLRGRLSAQLQIADAESLVSSFRMLLRGISDAELLLNGNFEIQAGTGLDRILLSGKKTWEGSFFQDLLAPDIEEKERFLKFMSRQDVDLQSATRMGGTPPCLRVSLASSRQQRVGVDIFHVLVPDLYGCANAFHLLAVKVDAESTTVPEAAPARFSMPTRHAFLPAARPSSLPSSRRSVASDEPSWLRSPEHLHELVLVVDPQWQELLQVHMQYKERQAGSGLRAMRPTLQQLVRPTDWPTVSSNLRHYVLQARQGDLNATRLGTLWIRTLNDSSKYMQATQTTMSFKDGEGRGPSGQVWLHLRGFQHLKTPPAPSDLDEVSEIASEHAEELA